ncbi:MAG TPA: sigma-70 family RNA polymerase sigma factor [Polyangiales bacterium]
MKPAPGTAAENAKSLNEQASRPSDQVREVRKDHEDDALVDQARKGDRAAFQALFQKYHRRAYAVAIGVVKRPADAMDVVQDAFIKVHKHIANFQGTSSFYTWLYRIVMNLSIDHLRKKRKIIEFDEHIKQDDAAGDGSLLPHMPDQNPSKTVIRHELTEKIRAALDTLPEYHRAVILLREVEGMSYEEMAQALEVPKGTIMSRLFHARRKMQEQLKPYLEGDLEIVE